MIKRFTFARRRRGVAPAAFRATWLGAVGWATLAPADARPARVASCLVIPGLDADPQHDGVGVEWFTDADHLGRFLGWLDGQSGAPIRRLAECDPVVLIAEERVLRGPGWLERRWCGGRPKLKHLALARRAPGLTAAEFSERWRAHAGSLGATVIPDEARGQAYIQNHPCAESAYDAVNEVYFDDVEGLRMRIAWFRANSVGETADDLFGQSWFVPVREHPIPT
jgi:hypothetical protein